MKRTTSVPVSEYSKSAPDLVTNLLFYHSNITTKEQVRDLMSRAKQGQFILRDSFSEPGCYTFSVMHQTGLKHIKLERHGESLFSLRNEKFESIKDLVIFYSKNSIPNRENLPDVILSTPVTRPNHISSQHKDDDCWDYICPVSAFLTPASRRSDGYDVLRDLDNGVKQDVMRSIEQMDKSHREYCDCGLPMDEADLPRGWSVHLSREPDTLGQVYFLSSDGKSHWELPLYVCLDLSPEQQDTIRKLMHNADLRHGSLTQRAVKTPDKSTRSNAAGCNSLPYDSDGYIRMLSRSHNSRSDAKK